MQQRVLRRPWKVSSFQLATCSLGVGWHSPLITVGQLCLSVLNKSDLLCSTGVSKRVRELLGMPWDESREELPSWDNPGWPEMGRRALLPPHPLCPEAWGGRVTQTNPNLLMADTSAPSPDPSSLGAAFPCQLWGHQGIKFLGWDRYETPQG